MSQTPREIVTRCLRFEYPRRIPRQLWVLPWAQGHFPDKLADIHKRYPDDIVAPAVNVYRPSKRSGGDAYETGTFTDEWGCIFENVQKGIHGQVKKAVIEKISGWTNYQPPYEILPEDVNKAREQINRFCGETDKFVLTGCCPRPWERMQFLRGTVNAMMDITEPEKGAKQLINSIHQFYLKELQFWVKTDVDSIVFMDDWGSQNSLLINPEVWRSLFKPLYKDYCDLAHANGKFAFMHSDGCIMDVYEDLIEVGVDAINSQLFTMDLKELSKKAKGKITFWGEIDRQFVLTDTDPEVTRRAVNEVAEHLYDPAGGIIAQLEFGPGIYPENAMMVFEQWEKVHIDASKKLKT